MPQPDVAAAFDGIVVVDKPLGLSSMDVVRHVRRAAGRGLEAGVDEATGGAAERGPSPGPSRGEGGRKKRRTVKTGHAGTLDPLATGVVICCLGRATKRVEELMGLTKVYEAAVDLTAFTTTDDREGERTEVTVDPGARPTRKAVEAVCAGMVGEVDQVPPAFSAIHVRGKRAYALARRGEAVTLGARRVRIDGVEVLGYEWPTVTIRVTCGRGTYIRSVGRDLGRTLGTGGHLASLRRTAVGPYRVEGAWGIERFEGVLLPGDLLGVGEG